MLGNVRGEIKTIYDFWRPLIFAARNIKIPPKKFLQKMHFLLDKLLKIWQNAVRTIFRMKNYALFSQVAMKKVQIVHIKGFALEWKLLIRNRKIYKAAVA